MRRASRVGTISWALLAALCASLFSAASATAQSCSIAGIRDEEEGELWLAADQVVLALAGGSSPDESVERLDGHWLGLIARAGAATAAVSAPDGDEPGLKFAADVGETMRNDKQVGSAGGASGTTTLSERAAIPLLLGLAVEHGAIRQEQSGTSLTLSTSPYGVLAAAREDNQQLYENNAWARMIGVSANFTLDGDGSEGLNGLERSELASVSTKLVFGDRSTRSAKFRPKWEQDVKPIYQRATDAELELWGGVYARENSAVLKSDIEDWSHSGLRDRLPDMTAGLDLTSDPGKDRLRVQLMDAIHHELCERVFAKVTLGQAEKDALNARFAEIRRIRAAADKALVEAIEEFQREPLFSLGYTLNRTLGGSDYSEIKLIGDGLFPGGDGPLELIVNANLSINHEPDSALDQKKIRDYGANLSLVWTAPNRLTGRLPGNSEFTTIALSFSGEFRRLADIGENMGTAQLKIGLPFTSGLQLPLSLSYSTRTETSSKDDFKIGVGFEFDTDKLLALAGLRGK